MEIESATEALQTLLRQEGRISKPRELVTYLAKRLNEGRTLVAAALEQLAIDGLAKLEKTGDVYDSVEYLAEVPASAPLSKKDEWSRLMVEDINFVLVELRKRATDGKLDAGSCTSLIRQIMEEGNRSCDRKRAAQINKDLGDLGLRRSDNLGNARYAHHIDCTDRMVTLEDRQAIQRRRTERINQSKATAASKTEIQEVSSVASVEPVELSVDETPEPKTEMLDDREASPLPDETPEETIRRLLAIIRELNGRCGELQDEINRLKHPKLPADLRDEVEAAFREARLNLGT